MSEDEGTKLVFDPHISLGHIFTIISMVFLFGGFYTTTNAQMAQFQDLLKKHSEEIEEMKIEQAVIKAVEKRNDNGSVR